MNPIKLRNILNLYKVYFPQINSQEIYKWRAVKCFQDNWDSNREDFPKMLEYSLKEAKNLLDAGLYYPKRMLINNAYVSPEKVKKMFYDLYNEEIDLVERINLFKSNFKALNDINFQGKNHYQDDRAVIVYLTLKYPEKYFFYKFGMFLQFVELIDYPFRPTKGRIENVLQYDTLCQLIRSEVQNDVELLSLHSRRISEQEYNDVDYHILTQDIIYAATWHFDKFKQIGTKPSITTRLTKKEIDTIPKKTDNAVLIGRYTNYLELAKENKRIGDLGELLVFEYEKEKVKKLNIKGEVIHSSKRFGDGLGYDIQSLNEEGEIIFIEVKTTKGNYNTPFFITINELEFSNKKPNDYYLYRLYDYDTDNYSASFYSRKGSLIDFCNNPVVYKALII